MPKLDEVWRIGQRSLDQATHDGPVQDCYVFHCLAPGVDPTVYIIRSYVIPVAQFWGGTTTISMP